MTEPQVCRSPAVPGPDTTRRIAVRKGLNVVAWGGLALLLGACSSHPARPVATDHFRPRGPYSPVRNDLALVALSLLDTAYAWGGRGPATGFDCSGLVAHVYREGGGIRLQGNSADLGKQSRPVNPASVLPGDLVFFNTLGHRHSHVGIYVGDGRFVHASNPRTGVRVDRLSNRYYAQRFEGAHSLLD